MWTLLYIIIAFAGGVAVGATVTFGYLIWQLAKASMPVPQPKPAPQPYWPDIVTTETEQ
jgi:hypothetical protein